MSETVSKTSIVDVVVQALADRVDLAPSEFDLDWPLPAIPGIDSLLLLSTLVDIEEASHVTIPDDVLFQANSIRELATLIADLTVRP